MYVRELTVSNARSIMFGEEMLSVPLNWPPKSFSEWSAERDTQSHLSSFSIIRWLQKWNRWSIYRYRVVFPVEQELTRQILERPSVDMSLLAPRERDILQLFAVAFKQARATPSMPPIYLDDQLELLLWELDEMTLLTFKITCEKRFGIRINQDAMWKQFTRPGATVNDLLKFFVSIVDSKQF